MRAVGHQAIIGRCGLVRVYARPHSGPLHEPGNIEHPTPNIEGIFPVYPEAPSHEPDRGCVADQPQHVRKRCGWLSAQPRSGSWVQCAIGFGEFCPPEEGEIVSRAQAIEGRELNPARDNSCQQRRRESRGRDAAHFPLSFRTILVVTFVGTKFASFAVSLFIRPGITTRLARMSPR